ncbi:MAG TPA: dienelactone hydrolase family protein [Fimbriiglobus sp.]
MTVVIVLFTWARPRPYSWLICFAVALLSIVITVHIISEGIRWQMLPEYVVCIYIFIEVLIANVGLGNKYARSVVLAFAMAGLFASVMLPVCVFPAPTGPYAVGTVTRVLTDVKRPEPRTGGEGDRRQVLIQVWYPALHAGIDPVPYKTRAELPFRIWRLALVKTHSFAGVPISSENNRFPVIIYSPSWTGSRSENTIQFEELASRGFVVVAMDHPYGGDRIAFPDGKVIRSHVCGFLAGESVKELETNAQQMDDELDVRVADARFVLDELAHFDQEDPDGLLTGRLDLTRIGMMGYSFGGAVAVETSFRDDRIKAAINFDGSIFGKSARTGITCPYLFATTLLPSANSALPDLPPKTAEEWRAIFDANDAENERRSLTTSGGSLLEIPGTKHLSFSVGSLHSPIARWRAGIEIDPRLVMRILNDYVVGFFQEHLGLSGPDNLEGLAAKYPEVRFRTWPKPVRKGAAPAAGVPVLAPNGHTRGSQR